MQPGVLSAQNPIQGYRGLPSRRGAGKVLQQHHDRGLCRFQATAAGGNAVGDRGNDSALKLIGFLWQAHRREVFINLALATLARKTVLNFVAQTAFSFISHRYGAERCPFAM